MISSHVRSILDAGCGNVVVFFQHYLFFSFWSNRGVMFIPSSHKKYQNFFLGNWILILPCVAAPDEAYQVEFYILVQVGRYWSPNNNIIITVL